MFACKHVKLLQYYYLKAASVSSCILPLSGNCCLMSIFKDSLTCTTLIILLFYSMYTNERMLVYNEVEIKEWTVHTMTHSKQEDSYNCGVYCLMVCFDVQTKKACIYIMFYTNFSVLFYVTFHFNFFYSFHHF